MRFAAAIGVERRTCRGLRRRRSCRAACRSCSSRCVTRAAVERVDGSTRRCARCCRARCRGAAGLLLHDRRHAGDGAAQTVYSRMLAPGFGITEDPATGGASGPLGCYLFHYSSSRARGRAHIVSLQGVMMCARAASTSRSTQQRRDLARPRRRTVRHGRRRRTEHIRR